MRGRINYRLTVQFAYQKASRWWGLWITLVLLGVAGLYLTMFGLISTGLDRRIGLWTVALALLPLFLAVGTGLTIMSRLNRRRIGQVSTRLRSLGFQVVEKPSADERSQFAAPIAHLLPTLGLQTGATGIKWFAVEQEPATKARLFEHEFVTGSGKTTQEHHHTVIVWPAGHRDLHDAGIPTAPWFFMGRFTGLIRRATRKRELKLPEFADVARTWSLVGDATTAARFLTPEIRRILDHSPKNEAWSVGAGWVCCEFKGTLDAENAERFLTHARSAMMTIP
jgi:hypothetical protein